ncbi:hypothetical protein MMC21_004620 [Puttea exsequens]|nr:hypothetical protein [Puttea exsequens]
MSNRFKQIFACAYGHQTKIEDGSKIYWYNIDGGWAEEDSNAYQSCLKGDGVVWAYSYRGVSDADRIKICPWFLSYIHSQRWADASGVQPDWLVDVPEAALTAIRHFQAAPVDLYALFEHAILHELTHTEAGGNSDDYTVPGRVSPAFWLAATGVGENGAHNAESLAYAGLCADLISRGFAVDRDGKIMTVS